MKSVVGQSLPRVDGQEKVTGKAIYASDFKLPGMVYGKVLRSLLPHGRIRHMDSRKAESMRGVLAVLTRENLQVAFPYFGAIFKDQPIVALEKVRYAGDIVAAVAATEPEIAEEALKEIEVDYEELPAVITLEEALKEGAPLVHEKLFERKKPNYGRGATNIVHENSNILHHFRYERGDVERGFGEADFVFEATFVIPSAQHYQMEPHISLANFESDHVTIWCGIQVPFSLRQVVSQMFGIPLSRVRVIVPYVGGGFGGQKGLLASILAVALSRLVHRPVQVAFSADESFKTICQPRAKVTLKTGVKKDGTFVARQCEVYLIAGAYAHLTPQKAEKMACRAPGPYRIPHLLTNAYVVYTNTVPATAFRGYGGQHVAFAYESHLDMIAHRLEVDPLEIRMKNLLERGEEYYPGDTPMDCNLKAGLKQVAEAIGWNKMNTADALSENGIQTRRFRGKGIACTAHGNGGTNKPAYAIVKILTDGSVLICSATVEIGQGARTALLQIVADELSVSPEGVTVAEIDTQYTPYDMGTISVSGITLMGLAVQKAARDAREQLLSAAASALGTQVTGVELNEGTVVGKGKSLSFQEVMRLYSGDTGSEIVGRGFYKVPRIDEAPLGYPTPFWEVGIGGAEVEVDVMTGEVKILKYVSLGDAGKMIHPIQCQGQEEGGVMFGIGHTLFEELVYQDGQLINANLVDYRLPKFCDLPQSFTSIIHEQGGGPGPYGAKGMGDGGVVAVAAAVCNGVYNAIGVRFHEVPLRAERVWQAIERHRQIQRKSGPD